MISITEKSRCTGCFACVQSCPVGCIQMVPDSEGFWYPSIKEEQCIDCGVCENRCPIMSPIKKQHLGGDMLAYAAYTNDEDIRKNSSSGGLFSEIASWIIENGGVVFGAAFDNKLNVRHIYAENISDLVQLRGSKYVQSYIGSTYSEAENFLKKGRLVLFTGTPCQISGLFSYLGEDYENLVTQDIICHGVPSPAVFRQYIKYREEMSGAQTKSVCFRNKQNGWKQYSITFDFFNGTRYSQLANRDLYMKSFLSNRSLRPSCYNCVYKKKSRESDFTLADFWGIENILPQIDDNVGTSLVICHSKKAIKILESLNIQLEPVPLDEAIIYNQSMICSSSAPKDRNQFIEDVCRYGFHDIEKKYFKTPLSTKLKQKVKKFLRH